jgi:hypothetical protein
MPPVGFESTILASERSKTHALDRTATGSALLFVTSQNLEYTVMRSFMIYTDQLVLQRKGSLVTCDMMDTT